MDILVIGAGIFGCTIASKLAQFNHKIVLIDKENDLMQKASKVNHNRIHFGYHYPRSIETAKQCIDSLPGFLLEYGESVISDFPNYYAIANTNSYIRSDQFLSFCDNLRINCRAEYPSEKFLNKSLIDSCFRVREPIFSYDCLKDVVNKKISKKSNIIKKFGTTIISVNRKSDRFLVEFKQGADKFQKYFHKVINASYSGLNVINNMFQELPIDLRFESTIVPVFEYNSEKVGVTIMDGPFCTIMPYGHHKNKFLLWSVDQSVLENAKNINNLNLETENYDISKIYKISENYLPFLKHAKHIETLHTVKTVVENKYDARKSEIFLGKDGNFIAVLSGKIMCCVKIAHEICEIIEGRHRRDIL